MFRRTTPQINSNSRRPGTGNIQQASEVVSTNGNQPANWADAQGRNIRFTIEKSPFVSFSMYSERSAMKYPHRKAFCVICPEKANARRIIQKVPQ
jgi:hypothetical protein